jgi:4-hydroxybenzoate polyprenyltransferase
MESPATSHIADARPGNWVERHAPAWALPYAQLARFDRPIGTWLLLLPGWWALAIAAPPGQWPDWWFMALFGVGAVVMRGAGCVLNDLADRDFDGKVERTRNRPLPSGRVTPRAAIVWMGALCLIGLAILLQLPTACWWLGVFSLLLVVIYPFMKRVTWWPQFFLGLAFNWGVPMGWAAMRGTIEPLTVVLYVAGIAWTLGYDTIYAHQDKEDDALIGVKSTARRLGDGTRPWIAGFYTVMVVLLAVVIDQEDMAWQAWAGLTIAVAHLARQVVAVQFENAANCLYWFRANKWTALILLAGFILGR